MRRHHEPELEPAPERVKNRYAPAILQAVIIDARAGAKNGGGKWPGGSAAAGVAVGLRTLEELFAQARGEINTLGFEDDPDGSGPRNGVYHVRTGVLWRLCRHAIA